MDSPVCGLRAVRAFRCAVLNVPKPTKVIESPFFSDLVMPSINDSTAAAAPALDDPVSLATFAISSCLFMGAPLQRTSLARATRKHVARMLHAVIRDGTRGVNEKARFFGPSRAILRLASLAQDLRRSIATRLSSAR